MRRAAPALRQLEIECRSLGKRGSNVLWSVKPAIKVPKQSRDCRASRADDPSPDPASTTCTTFTTSSKTFYRDPPVTHGSASGCPLASPNQACAYLRSSKDRHGLSLDAQRSALQDYAHEQSLAIVAEFADAVESGKNQLAPQRILRIYMRAETLAAEVLPLAILASR